MKLSFLLIALTIASLSFSQGIPQIQPINATLGANTHYLLNYFSLKNIPSTTTFTIDFSTTDIQLTEGPIQCNASLNDVSVPSPSCSCTGSICELKPNQSASYNTKVMIEFAGLTNPMYLSTQRMSVNIYFNPSITQENYDISIPYSAYKTMDIIVNSFEQSDYGVGSTPVSYIFNLSLYYISQNFQLQIQIPEEVGYSSISSEMSFYGTVQNIMPFQIQSLLIFNIQTEQIDNPEGYMLLNLTGFANPQYIGSSSSFELVFQETKAQANCATCKIAELTDGIFVESKTPGDIKILSMTSTNIFVSNPTTFSINLELYAGVPEGGKIFIDLPAEVEPVLPVTCKNVYGFTLSTGQTPLCTYSESEHRISTQNFASPYDIEIGNAIISVDIYNPHDSQSVEFSLETTDDQGRTIGKTRNPRSYSAVPLQMNSVATKTNSEVGSEFNLYCQITLQMKLTSDNIIEVVFPSGVEYDESNIKCVSAGQDLSCNVTSNAIDQLVVTMAPPCVMCSNGDKLNFTINKLRNPSYINDNMQIIYIHTKTTEGIIEAAEHTIDLLPANVNLLSYSKPTNQLVGSDYNLTFSLQPPEYVTEKGGQIQILFDENAVYTDVQIIDALTYSMVYQVNVIDSNNKVYENSIQYYSNTTPKSIKKIIFTICSDSSCSADTPLSFTIQGFKQPYIPALQTKQIIKICTILGEEIGQKTIDTSSYAPLQNTNSLSMQLTKSITNTRSEYKFTFVVPEIVIDNELILQLSLGQTISGSCSLAVDEFLAGTHTCEKTDNRTIKILMDFDQALMITKTITYTITINDVSTPTSTAPLKYSLSTTFNSIKNEEFEKYYSVEEPFPLEATITKSNNTIHEDCNLVTTITPLTEDYDSYDLQIPINIIIIEKTKAEQEGFQFTKNSTHYILKQSNKMADNKVTIEAQNTISTVDKGDIVLTTLKQNYEVQKVTVEIGYTEPITLGIGASSSNSTVGTLTNLTITVDRNNEGWLQQTQIIIYLPEDAFSYEEAQYNNALVDQSSLKVRVPIEVNSPRVIEVIINKVKNLLYIPLEEDTLEKMKVETVKLGSQKIGINEIDVKYMVSDDAYDNMNLSATRNVTKSSDFTGISINYVTALGKTGDLIEFTLPENQNQYLGSSGCMKGSPDSPSYSACTIISSNASVVIAVFEKGEPYTLTNVLNYHPNENDMLIRILTSSNQLIEEASTHIEPDILLEELHVTIIPSDSVVAQPNQLIISLKSVQLPIESDHSLTISMPTQTFTRKLSSEDCSIEVQGNTYTGCNYEQNAEEWLASVKIPSLSPFTIEANVSIIIRLHVTNAWSAYPFKEKTILFQFHNSDSSSLSEGKAPLVEVFSSMSTFQLQEISSNSLQQSSLQASKPNNLTLTVNFEGNYKKEAEFVVMVPKDTYEINVGGENVEYYKEDALYYYVKTGISCDSDVCVGGYNHVQVLNVQNNKYVKNSRNKMMSYIIYDSYPVTKFASLQPQIYSPQTVHNLSLQRSNQNAYENVQTTISFSLDSTFTSISMKITNYLGEVDQITLKETNGQGAEIQTAISSFTLQNNVLEFELSPTTLDTVELNVQGKNGLLVPVNEQILQVNIYNQTHNLYEKTDAKYPLPLVPYKLGLSLKRQEATVSMNTEMTLEGQLPDQNINWGDCIVEVNEINYEDTLSNNIVNVDLDTARNPSSINNEPLSHCKITLGQYVVYENSQLVISPALIPIEATGTDITIEMPDKLFIHEEADVIVKITNPHQAKEFVLSLPPFFQSVVSAKGKHENTEIISTYSLTQGDENVITITSTSPILIDEIVVTVKAVAYQQLFENKRVGFDWETPSTTYEEYKDISIFGEELTSEVTSSSLKTNEQANYSIKVTSIQKDGQLKIVMSEHVSQQMENLKDSLQVLENGNLLQSSQYTVEESETAYTFILPTTSANKIIQLNLASVSNPSSNKPQLFTFIQRKTNSPSQIYGYKEDTLVMEEFDDISITKAHRNTSKIAANIEIQMVIISPSYTETMFIQLPQTQVIFSQTECLIEIDGVQDECRYESNNTISTINQPGSHVYLLKSLFNVEYSVNPSTEDKAKVWLGDPYMKAESKLSTSVYITPLIVTGTIEMLQATSSNNKRSEYTTLSYSMKSENWQKCDGMVIQYNERAYWAHENMECRLNGKIVKYMLINSYSIFVEVGNQRNQTMNLQIKRMINYFESGPFTIETVKQKTEEQIEEENNLLQSSYSDETYAAENYGILDKFSSDQPISTFSPSKPSIRIILPDNYVSNKEKTIIAMNDGDIPQELPTSNLYYTFKSDDLGCSASNLEYEKQLKLKCTVSVAGSIDFTVSLHDSDNPDLPLTVVTESMKIFKKPSDSCSNALCDLCSQDGNNEYCFECREELVSSDGVCIEECPSSTFNYEQVCTECAPECSECFDLHDSTCLECSDEQLVLDSGICTESCTTGFNHNGNCVSDKECDDVDGCRICSTTGFCYECLPDYEGEPECSLQQLLPPTVFTYTLAPFLLMLVIFPLVLACKEGCSTVPSMLIFFSSLTQFWCWIFTIPRIPEHITTMVLSSFVLLRIILSIVSYETYYNRHIDKQKESTFLKRQNNEQSSQTEKKEEEEISPVNSEEVTCKERSSRFFAHFLNCDSYELLQTMLGKPYMLITHNKAYMGMSIVNRVLVMILMVYILTYGKVGDLMILPLVSLVMGMLVMIIRTLRSSCFQSCLNRIRS